MFADYRLNESKLGGIEFPAQSTGLTTLLCVILQTMQFLTIRYRWPMDGWRWVFGFPLSDWDLRWRIGFAGRDI